jgi:hypothetical protein
VTQDSQGHTWVIDEDGVCEYDQGYLCPCGARKVTMAEGDEKLTPEALAPCPLPGPAKAAPCRLTSWVNWCPCHGWCL